MTDLHGWVLGIDPGKVTGLALYNINTGAMTTEEEPDGRAVVMEKWIEAFGPAVAVEAFVITAQTHKNSAAPWSLWGIGVARHLAHKYGVPFTIQGQSASKNFSTDKKLKALGWYVRGKPHGVDAQRQVLLWLVDNGWWDPRLD
ncbi:MAG: hypothetical protein JWR85_4065 [Marmoricola sp.]|nr:hypothetical protein [Marmoricola sp.]